MANDGMHLGLRPETLRVLLSADADFLCTLRLNQDWPEGTTLKLVVGTSTWAAAIDGANAVFATDKSETDNIPTGTSAQLVYTNGDVDQVWARGTVVRHD